MTTSRETSLARDVKEIKNMMGTIVETQTKQGNDLESIKTWRLSQEAAKKAVDEYKAQEALERRDKRDDKFIKTKSELVRTLIPLAIALTALVYAYVNRVQ